MTTKQIIQEQMKSFDYEFVITSQWQQKEWRSKYSTDFVKAFIHSYTHKLIESLAEEIIGSSYDWFAKWREYVNSKYDKKEAGVIDNYPYWLTEQQRLKVKEIITNFK